MKFVLKDLQRIGAPPIGTIELSDGYGPVEIANLLRSGWLHFQTEMSAADRKVIEAEQAKNEAEAAAIQNQIDAEASVLPEGNYALLDLTAKQLKALCAKRGLVTNGNRFDLIDRLEKEAPVEADAPKPKKTKK